MQEIPGRAEVLFTLIQCFHLYLFFPLYKAPHYIFTHTSLGTLSVHGVQGLTQGLFCAQQVLMIKRPTQSQSQDDHPNPPGQAVPRIQHGYYYTNPNEKAILPTNRLSINNASKVTLLHTGF